MSENIFNMHNEKDLDSAKVIAWHAKDECIKSLKNKTAEIYFQTEFPDLKQAFLKKLEAVVCMDEGCAH